MGIIPQWSPDHDHTRNRSDLGVRVDMTRFIKERLSAIKHQTMSRQERTSHRREPFLATGCGGFSLSWIAQHCRPDEAETDSTLQGSVSRTYVKHLSDANGSVNRLKQTKEVEVHFHPIPPNAIRTASVSDTALDLDQPDRSTQGGILVGFTTPESHQHINTVPHHHCGP